METVTGSDFVHANYGVPSTFATHTLSTIAGPADAWTVGTGWLAPDLTLWLGGMVAILLVFAGIEGRSGRPGRHPTPKSSQGPAAQSWSLSQLVPNEVVW